MTNRLIVKNGFYIGVISYKDENGKYKQKWINTKLPERGNKKAAQSLMDEKMAELELELSGGKKLQISPDKADITLNDYLLEFAEEKLNSETISYLFYQAYLSRISVMERFFGKELKLKKVTADKLNEFYDYLKNERKLKIRTIKYYSNILTPALKKAKKEKLINEDPCEDAVKIRVNKSKLDNKINYFNATEIEELLAKIKGHKLEIVVTIACYYGLRRSEILGLKWDAIDFENKCITVKHKVLETDKGLLTSDNLKTKSSYRTLPLFEEIEKMLLEHKDKIAEHQKIFGNSYNKKYLDYICVNELGDLITPNYVTDGFRRFLKADKLKKIRFHDLRHSCASLLLSKGAGIKEIQEWLGHSNYSTTADVYSHLDYSSKLKLADIISGTISKPTETEISIDEEIAQLEKMLEEKRKQKKKDFEM